MSKKSQPLQLVPRGLSRVQAATYIGVSTTFFDQLVADGRMPPPKRINSRKLWDRWALDSAFEELPEDGASELARWLATRQGSDDQQSAHYLNALGYDPRGMTPEEIKSAEAEQVRVWEEKVRRQPLNKREMMALRGLEEVGDWIPDNAIKGASIGTQERLIARGYVEHRGEPDRFGEWRITHQGRSALTRFASS